VCVLLTRPPCFFRSMADTSSKRQRTDTNEKRALGTAPKRPKRDSRGEAIEEALAVIRQAIYTSQMTVIERRRVSSMTQQLGRDSDVVRGISEGCCTVFDAGVRVRNTLGRGYRHNGVRDHYLCFELYSSKTADAGMRFHCVCRSGPMSGTDLSSYWIRLTATGLHPALKNDEVRTRGRGVCLRRDIRTPFPSRVWRREGFRRLSRRSARCVHGMERARVGTTSRRCRYNRRLHRRSVAASICSLWFPTTSSARDAAMRLSANNDAELS